MNCTTAQAAELAGIKPASFRREMMRERQRGRDHRAPREQWPDKRTPLWDEAPTAYAWDGEQYAGIAPLVKP